MKRNWLDDFLLRAREERRSFRVVETAWAWGRLFSFLAAAVFVYWFWSQRYLALTGAAMLLIGFAISVRRHVAARAQRVLADHLLSVIEETAQRLGGSLNIIRGGSRPAEPSDPNSVMPPFFDDGAAHELTEQERGDLDLYTTPVGLFGLLNRTSTAPGARRLRDLLERTSLHAAAIIARQQAVARLDAEPEVRLRLMAASLGLRSRSADTDRFIAALRTSAPFRSAGRMTFLRIWGGMAFLFSIYAFYRTGQGDFAWAAAWVTMLSVHYFLLAGMRREVLAALRPWSALLPVVQDVRQAGVIAAEHLPTEPRLTELRAALQSVTDMPVLQRLERRLAWTDASGMIHALLNVVAFWDLQLAASILKVVLPHREQLLRGLEALAELDAYAALAAFAWEQPRACYPQISEHGHLHIQGGVHPLLDPARAVPNDLELTGDLRTWIVTGSNMAGKSTYLRMVGVNGLLAQAGTVATAQAMTWRPVHLITDLRAADSLGDSESYFLAEVRHIRRMVLPPENGVPCVGLIDEPFRGTNSQEQVAASLAVAEHLIASPHFFLIATHDQRLTELADDVRARNLHFREQLEGSGMVFDYLLRPGPARSRNALRVLEREGYPAGLVRRAHERLREAE